VKEGREGGGEIVKKAEAGRGRPGRGEGMKEGRRYVRGLKRMGVEAGRKAGSGGKRMWAIGAGGQKRGQGRVKRKGARDGGGEEKKVGDAGVGVLEPRGDEASRAGGG